MEGLRNETLKKDLHLKTCSTFEQVTREALYLVDNCKAYGEVSEDAESIASGTSSVKSETSIKKDLPAAPTTEQMIEEITKRIQQQMKNPVTRYPQMRKCNIYGGDHPTPWCTQQPKAPIATGRVLKWCAVEQKWTNHAIEECYYNKDYVRERPYGPPAEPPQPPPPRYQVGPNVNAMAGADRPQRVLGQQPPLPHKNRAMIRYAQPYEAPQHMSNAPMITYYEEPNESYITEPEQPMMPRQKTARQWDRAPYEADELSTNEKSHIPDEVLAQIPAHIFIVSSAVRVVHLENFFRLPPWGTDYMRAHELMSSIQYDGKAMLTDNDGEKVEVLITKNIINEALHFIPGAYDLIPKTKAIDNEKAFLKIKEALSKKAEEPVLEPTQGSQKRPRQEEEEEIEDIQAYPIPPSPINIPPAPPSSPITPFPLASTPQTPPSPLPLETPLSPPAPTSPQQQHLSAEPSDIPAPTTEETPQPMETQTSPQKETAKPLDKVDEEKQTEGEQHQPTKVDVPILMIQKEEPSSQEAILEVRSFNYTKLIQTLSRQFQYQQVVAKETEIQKTRANQAQEEIANLRTALDLVTKERDSSARENKNLIRDTAQHEAKVKQLKEELAKAKAELAAVGSLASTSHIQQAETHVPIQPPQLLEMPEFQGTEEEEQQRPAPGALDIREEIEQEIEDLPEGPAKEYLRKEGHGIGGPGVLTAKRANQRLRH
ncbi:hypothetical protein L7F22_026866 [Adiantum nelumboides]|nr:hypothetical protein [Adiantum nelumboides]